MTEPERFAGRYRLLELLGRGGMGAVFRAHDEERARPCALKRLRSDADPKQAALAASLLEREYHGLRQLAHPRIVQAYEWGRTAEGPYYTMELLDGESLRTLAPLPFQEACLLLGDVCSALALLHSRRLLHRDLTPRNVQRVAAGHAKLVDFGALAPMGSRSRRLIGTPAFIAPELFYSQDADGRADLFALGALAYFLLTGKNAYNARRMSELQDAWRSPPPRLAQLVTEIPPALDALVSSLLSLDASARPATAHEVIARLGAIADLGEGESAEAARAYLRTPALVGRRAEQLSIRKRVLRSQRGRGAALMICGPRGAGRTRLLGSVALDAEVSGALTAQSDGRSHGGRPHGVLQALIAELLARDARVVRAAAAPHLPLLVYALPELGARATSPVALADLEPRVREPLVENACVEFLAELSKARWSCLLVDDLESVDAPSLGVLGRLWERTAELPLLMAMTVREETIAGQPAAAELAAMAKRVEVGALSADQTRDLLASLFGDVPNLEPLSRVVQHTGAGLPGSTMALLQHLLDRGLIAFSDGVFRLPAQLSSEDLPKGLQDAIVARFDALSPAARELAQVLSLATPLAPPSLADYPSLLPDHAGGEVFAAVRELVEGQLVHQLADGDLWLDPRLRDSAGAALDDVSRRRLHAALAGVYARRGDARVIGVHHLLQAGEVDRAFEALPQLGDERPDPNDPGNRFMRSDDGGAVAEAVLAYAERTGQPRLLFAARKSLLSLAAVARPDLVHHAVPLFAQLRQAVGLDDVRDGETDTLAAFERALARFEAADPSEQERMLPPQRAIAELAVCLQLRSSVTIRSYDVAGLDALREGVTELPPLSPAIELLREVLDVAHSTMKLGATVPGRQQALVERCSQPVEGMDETTRLGARLVSLYYLGLEASLFADADVLTIADELEPFGYFAPHACCLRMLYYTKAGDFAQAEHWRRRGEVLLLSRDIPDEHLAASVLFELNVCFETGEMTMTDRVRRKLAREAERFEGYRPWALLSEGLWQLQREDLASARSALERARELTPPLSHGAWHHVAATLAECMLYQGEAEAAHAVTSEADAAFARAGLRPYIGLGLDVSAAYAMAAVGEYAAALARLAGLVEQAREAGRGGAHIGFLYEAHARAALFAERMEDFERYATQARAQYAAFGQSTLIQRHERLMQRARERGRSVPPPAWSLGDFTSDERAASGSDEILGGDPASTDVTRLSAGRRRKPRAG